MTENFLHHLWKLKLFNFQDLFTTDGERIEIIKTGIHNTDAGPDFFNAHIRIGNTLWAGNAEIHLKSSDWKNHAHEKDEAYDNVILHIVYEHDAIIHRKDGTPLPTLELKGKFDQRLWQNFLDLQHSRLWIPCQHRIREVDALTLNNWLDRLLAERLEEKTKTVFASLQSNNNDWEETFYQLLAKNFGFRINAVPFEMLAKSLPMAYLAKHKDHLNQVEALLFGQAGMLNETFKDDYPKELQQEYIFLKNKYDLHPLALHSWKFLRLRPVNFPTLRIAQFAQLIHESSNLFSKILECDTLEVLEKYFNTSVSDYWKTHFTFDKVSACQPKHLGKTAFQNIVINTVVPCLVAYSKIRSSEKHFSRAVLFLENTPAEINSVTKHWKDIGIASGSAYRSQALLQLKNFYCAEKKCLTCSLGNKIISQIQ